VNANFSWLRHIPNFDHEYFIYLPCTLCCIAYKMKLVGSLQNLNTVWRELLITDYAVTLFMIIVKSVAVVLCVMAT